MIFRSHPKRDLYPDSALGGGSNVQGPKSKVQGPGAEVRGFGCQVPGFRFDEGGFTLIEVIAALIIVAVLAAMIFPVTGGQWRTARGVGECRELFELQGQMEEIVQVYKAQLANGDGSIDLEDFRNTVAGYSYVNAGGTGFLTESGNNLTLTGSPTSLLLVTLTAGDQRIASVFAGN